MAKPKQWEGKHYLYYEAILQMRDVGIEQVDYAIEAIQKEGVPIPKTVPHDNGIDLYLADARFGKIIGRRMQDRFGGIYHVTAKLFSARDGQNIYRLTILFRGVPFVKGETVLYKGLPHVVKVLGERVILQNAKTGKKIQFKCNQKDLALIKPRQKDEE